MVVEFSRKKCDFKIYQEKQKGKRKLGTGLQMFKAEAGPCATPRKPNAHNDRTKTYTECSVTSDNSPIEAD